MQAQQQDSDGSRTGNQAASQPEHDDLTRGHFAVGEAFTDVVGMSTFVRILIAINRQLQAFQFGMRMPVTMLLECQVVIMRMPGVSKAQASAELVRFRNIHRRLQKAFTLDERERLAAAVRTRRGQANIRGCPGVSAQGLQAPVRWHAFLEDRQFNTTMAGIYSVRFIMMTMVVFAVMVIIALLKLEHLLTAPGTPQHPQGNRDDQCRGSKLEIRLSGFSVQTFAQVHAADGDQPHHGGVRKRCGQPQQNSLFDRATDGHDEGRHHGFRMTGLQAMQGTEQNRAREIQPGVSPALLQQFSEIGHVRPKGTW